MDENNRVIDGVLVTSLLQIEKDEGSIFHGIKKGENSFHGFGEAYFSHIETDKIKAWKMHSEMWLNLVVPIGSVKFVLYDSRKASKTFGLFFEIVLSSMTNYKRLTIPPGITFGFMGVGRGINLVLNVANIEHDPKEVINFPRESIKYRWENEA